MAASSSTTKISAFIIGLPSFCFLSAFYHIAGEREACTAAGDAERQGCGDVPSARIRTAGGSGIRKRLPAAEPVTAALVQTEMGTYGGGMLNEELS